MQSSLIAILFLISFNAAATGTSTEKPDEFANKHWSALATPAPVAVPQRPAAKVFTAPMESPTIGGQYPKVALCHVSAINSQYLISDSDGVDACTEHGGEIVAGRDEDRKLINVKDSVVLKKMKK